MIALGAALGLALIEVYINVGNGYNFTINSAYGVGLFAILTIEGPRKVLFWAPLINVAGWGSYLISIHLGGFSEIMATYFGSLVIALISQMYARIFREPVTVFFIPAFFLFVPGGGMYRTALAFIQGNTAQGFTELGVHYLLPWLLRLRFIHLIPLCKLLINKNFQNLFEKTTELYLK